jgi:NAD(P)-dependent dehydrogenase (short-subunit alcohol dehydrogenase family)
VCSSSSAWLMRSSVPQNPDYAANPAAWRAGARGLPLLPIEPGHGQSGALRSAHGRAWAAQQLQKFRDLIDVLARLTSRHLAHAGFARSIREHTLLARTPALEEVDGPLLFLATAASGYMTGQTLIIDGGWTAV